MLGLFPLTSCAPTVGGLHCIVSPVTDEDERLSNGANSLCQFIQETQIQFAHIAHIDIALIWDM